MTFLIFFFFFLQINYISSIGGKDVKDFVRRVLFNIVSSDILENYSYLGRITTLSSKKCFSKLAICKCMVKGISKRNKEATLKTIEHSIAYVLQHIKDKKRKNKKINDN